MSNRSSSRSRRGAVDLFRPGLHPATFVGGATGAWRIERAASIIGEGLPAAERIAVHPGELSPEGGAWTLRGVAGHARYVTRAERTALDAASPPLGRPEATCAALIPIRKSPAWWALQQDERRELFEERSRHIADSLQYLPRIARRLYHARDLGEPFDFLTWFEFAPEHAAAFDDLVEMLRARAEWSYVDREVDLRLTRDEGAPPR
jgi:hypothetical protein